MSRDTDIAEFGWKLKKQSILEEIVTQSTRC